MGIDTAVKQMMDKYQKDMVVTAVYPKEHEGHYLPLGLCDEIAELLEKIKQAGSAPGRMNFQSKVIAEGGDVVWYVGRLCEHHGFSMGDMCAEVMTREYTGNADLRDIMDDMIMAAGRIAGCAKKKLRDGTDKQGVVFISLNDILFNVHLVSKAFGANILVTAMQNQDKLLGRKERGTLQGSGDDR